MGMSINLRRALLVILTLAGAYTGGWAYFAPHHWYTHFPGFGRSWLPQLGPYNEHLSKDAGAMFLALMVLSLFALHYGRSNRIAQITGLVWLTFNVLHPVARGGCAARFGLGDAVDGGGADSSGRPYPARYRYAYPFR
jgi:hypothetical protein